MNVKYIVKPQDFLWATSSPYSDDSEFQGIILVLLFTLPQEVIANQRNKTEDRNCNRIGKDSQRLDF